MPKQWEGSVFPYRGRLYVQFKDPKRGGKFSKRATPYKPGQEAEAEKVLASIREQLAAQARYLAAGSGEVSVQSYGEQWLKGRQHQSSWRDDQGRLREHVYPEIGSMPLANIRARHLLQL